MARSTLFSFAVAAACAVSGWTLAAAPAHACTCTGQGGRVSWPRRDAENVPIDTPIVITRQDIQTGDPESVMFALVDENGEEIELTEVRRLPQLDLDCWAEEVVFLHPTEPLEPNATYTVTGNLLDSSFTTGDVLYEPRPFDAVLHYLHVDAGGGVIAGCTEGECDTAEIVLRVDGPTERPVWVAVRSEAHTMQENHVTLWPEEGWPSIGLRDFELQVQVAVPDAARCVEVAVLDIDGEELLREERCEPDECVVWGGRSRSTCGGPLFTNLDASRVHDAPCDAPRRILATDAGVPDYDRVVQTSSTSCAVSPRSRTPTGFIALFMLLALYGARRLRRRDERSDDEQAPPDHPHAAHRARRARPPTRALG